jgi:hypothetical protein
MNTIDTLRAAYEAGFPKADPEIAFALGAALYKPGQRSAQDALNNTGIALNIFDLSPFASGWAAGKLGSGKGG